MENMGLEITRYDLLKKDFDYIKTDLDGMKSGIVDMKKSFDEMKEILIKQMNSYVTRTEFDEFKERFAEYQKYVNQTYISSHELQSEIGLLKKIVYGSTGIILTSVVGAIVSIVVR